MAECKVCGKALNKEASNIGSWCIDCIKEMYDTSTGNMRVRRDGLKKSRLRLLILASIGLIIGTVSLSDTNVFLGIWFGIGCGTALSLFIDTFSFHRQIAKAEGKSFGEFLKDSFLGVIIVGLIGGVIYLIIWILRENSYIKKFDTIISSEDGAMAELEGYTLGKEINTSDLTRKVSIIAANYELAKGGVSVDLLKQLNVVQ